MTKRTASGTRRAVGLALLTTAALVLAACASTPSDRIEADQAAFAKLPPEAQALIKQGQVGIGFDEFETKLALGEPDRITERVDLNGTSRVWRYVEYEADDGTLLYTGFYHHYYGPYGPGPFFAPYYLDYPSRRERDAIRVIFQDGHVNAIERELQ